MRRYAFLLVMLLSIASIAAEDVETFTIHGSLLAPEVLSDPADLQIIPVELSDGATAAEVLSRVPSIRVYSSGGAMQSTTVSLRGSDTDQVLILHNGRRVSGAQGGSVDLNSLMLFDVSHIEIISGASSAKYGESALAGVINIVTEEHSDELRLRSRASWGSYDTLEGSFNLTGPVSDTLLWQLSLGGMRTTADYEYTRESSQSVLVRENAGGWRVNGSAGLSTREENPGDRSFEISISGYADSKGVPGTIEFPIADASMQDTRFDVQLFLDNGYAPLADLSLQAGGSYQDRNYDEGDGSELSEHRSGSVEVKMLAERQDDFFWFSAGSTLSVGILGEYLASTGLDQPVSRFNRSLAWSTGLSSPGEYPLQLIPSLRIESLSAESLTPESFFSWSVGYVIPVSSDRFTIKGSIGNGYRLPSFEDLFWSESAFAKGNPDLEEEQALSADLTCITSLSRFSFETTAHYRRVQNLIQWVPDGTGQWTPVNIGDATLAGVDLRGEAALSDSFAFSCSYSFLYAVDATEGSVTYGKDLIRRAAHTADAKLSWRSEHLRLSASGRYVSPRWYTAMNTKYLPAYTIFDASGGYQLSDDLSIDITIKDLLDTEYIDIEEYPIPGRTITVSGIYTYGGER